MNHLAHALILLLLLFTSACSVNPVTGEKQLLFTSTAGDIEIGQTQYKPAQQSQGGQYYLDPALTAYVSKVGKKLAAVSDQPSLPYEFVVLNNSIPNAWALPSGKIAINRGLLTQLKSESQLAAVLGHEIVHAAARHGAQQMRDNLLVQAGMAGLGLTLADNDYRDLIIGGATLGASLTMAKYSRGHELESDYYGMQYMARAGYDLQGAIELQQLFVELSKSQQGNWLEGLFASHPPSPERVLENQKTAQALATVKGFTGEQEYQQALAYMRSKEPAYKLADQAAHALEKKQLAEALTLIDKAIEIEPKEALFRSVKGEILQQQGKADLALQEHNRATSLYPEQFSYYLKRAATYQSLGQEQAAQADYQTSMSKLPTSVAALQLGLMAQQRGNSQQARAYFTQAAAAAGPEGQQARNKLAQMELQERPAPAGGVAPNPTP